MAMDIDIEGDIDIHAGDIDISSPPLQGGPGVRPLSGKIPWPPTFDPISDPDSFNPKTVRVPLTKFPRHYWDPWRYAFATIEEFTRTDWKTQIVVNRPTPEDTDIGIQRLVATADTRAAFVSVMMPEILAQAGDASRYWQAMLMFNARSHPWTYQALQMAFHVGRFLAMYYKVQINFPRPSQLSPAILPWIDVPPHASHPSGHALEGMLMSLVLGDVVPEARKPLLKLAQRVGRNRETAGLHYFFDTDTGFRIAEEAFPLLMSCASCQEAVREAKKEWDALKVDTLK
jgi:membrane-associated phospholipid phosphatase